MKGIMCINHDELNLETLSEVIFNYSTVRLVKGALRSSMKQVFSAYCLNLCIGLQLTSYLNDDLNINKMKVLK